MSLRPQYVTTQLTDYIKGFYVLKPEQCARGALDMIGRQRMTNGHWNHRLQGFLFSSIPPEMMYWFESRRTKRLMSEHANK